MRTGRLSVAAALTVLVMITGCAHHPWFESRFPFEEGSDGDQIVLTASQSAARDTFTLNALPNGWQVGRVSGERAMARHPTAHGVLRLQLIATPRQIAPDRLRSMTNVPAGIMLPIQSWGGYEGYEHQYTENGEFLRQWWLAGQDHVLLLVYQCDVADRDEDKAIVDQLVRELTVSLD